MTTPWIDRSVVEQRLKLEATAVATRLGHTLAPWDVASSTTRCLSCSDVVTVKVRTFNAAPIAGAAVQLRCLYRSTGRQV